MVISIGSLLFEFAERLRMPKRLPRVCAFAACMIIFAPARALNDSAEEHEHTGARMALSSTPEQSPRPGVLIDQSHDFLFIVLHLGTFLKTHGFMGTFSHATCEPRIYQNCDVVVTHQSWSDVPYPQAQITALKKFVTEGGGLLLIGHGPGYSGYAKSRNLSFASWPINMLAAEFGFQFEHASGKLPFVVQKHALTEGVGEVTYSDKSPRVGIAAIPRQASVLLCDSLGQAVLAVREFGNGRVAILTEYRFIKTIDDAANTKLFANVFAWLGARSPNKLKFANRDPHLIFRGIELHKGHDYELEGKPEPPNLDGGPDFIWPEIQLKRGPIVLQYSASMKERAEYIVRQYPLVYNEIFELLKVEPAREMILEALPTAGGGYHWTKQKLVAIGALADDKTVLGIMGHEMVHAWGLPTPRNFSHGWTTFTDDYLSARLELRSPEKIAEDWNKELAKVGEIDPHLDSLDITEETTDPARQRLLDKKVGWILKELEKKYGLKFFSDLANIYRQQAKTLPAGETFEGLPIDEFVYYASLAAGEDLFSWFRSLGTTVGPRTIDPPE